MAPYRTERMDENEARTITLDNRQVSAVEFNSNLEKLKSNQKIIETKENQFFTVERFYD
jgi:hypothetical protein